MDNIRRLDNIMKVYNFDGGILHESLKKAIIENDLNGCNVTSELGIDKDLKYMLNMLIEEMKLQISIPF